MSGSHLVTQRVASIRGVLLANTGPGHTALRKSLLNFSRTTRLSKNRSRRLAGWQGHFRSPLWWLWPCMSKGFGPNNPQRSYPTSAILWLWFCDLLSGAMVWNVTWRNPRGKKLAHGCISCWYCTSGNPLTSLESLMTQAGEGRVRPNSSFIQPPFPTCAMLITQSKIN